MRPVFNDEMERELKRVPAYTRFSFSISSTTLVQLTQLHCTQQSYPVRHPASRVPIVSATTQSYPDGTIRKEYLYRGITSAEELLDLIKRAPPTAGTYIQLPIKNISESLRTIEQQKY